MAKAEKKDNKELSQDKSPKKAVKSSYSKKKKTKKNILNGIAYVQSTFNNTIVSIADTYGNVISWASAGQKLSLIHISEPTRRTPISYAVFCLKKKLMKNQRLNQLKKALILKRKK